MPKWAINLILSICGFLLTGQLAINLWFIGRQIEKTDSIQEIVWALRSQVALLELSIKNLQAQQTAAYKERDG